MNEDTPDVDHLGFLYSTRPPEGAPFVAEFLQTTSEPGGSESREHRFRVFQDQHGRQRFESLHSVDPEVWMGTVTDWPARREFFVASGVPMTESQEVDLSPTEIGAWQMGFPGEGKWSGRPMESTEEHQGLTCDKLLWSRPDGATVTVWISTELGHPIEEIVDSPERKQSIRFTKLERREPDPKWFRLPPGVKLEKFDPPASC